MNIETAIAGVLTERSALQQQEFISQPTYISEHMYLLTQYNSSLEESLAGEEKKLKLKEAELFKQYTASGDSVNKAQTKIKYELAADEAEIISLTRLCSSSRHFVSVAQSRIKHLIQEANNQI